MTPRTFFRRFALAEVVTWSLLLFGMFLKYVTRTTSLGVTVFGLLHGIVFLSYCLALVVVSTNQRWSLKDDVLGLLAGVPPFLTIWFERRQERLGRLGGGWRLGVAGGDRPANPAERVVAAVVARPVPAAVLASALVIGLTALLLWIGPPVPSSN